MESAHTESHLILRLLLLLPLLLSRTGRPRWIAPVQGRYHAQVDGTGVPVRAPLGHRDPVLIGVGATSRVYRAIQTKGGRTVALKRLHRQLVPNHDALARLKRELEALSRLTHPSIVQVFDVVRWDGDPTIVMEFVAGADLKERLQTIGPLPASEVERIGRAIFDALALVHAEGIVHRDIKPQNIRIAADGRIVLLDFGSARLDAAAALTKTGSTVGTPEYMPPELFVGPVYDPRSDIYGTGATLFECLTGRPPHSADTLAELAFLRSEIPAPPVRSLAAEVPENLAQVVDRCLQIRPEARFPSVALALWALDHPNEERLLEARKSDRPLCVHCGSAIAPESSQCPSCRSLEPFRFEPGLHHVVIDAVESVDKLVDWILAIVPERAVAHQLRGLAEHASSIAHERRRLVSFVSEADARHVVTDLRMAGVEAHVETEPSRIGVMAIGVLLGGMKIGIATATLAIAAAWLAASRDLISSHRWPVSPSAGPNRALLAASGFAMAGGLNLAAAYDRWTFTGAFTLTLVSLIGAAAAGTLFGVRDGPPSLGPALNHWKRWRLVLRAILGGGRAFRASSVAKTSRRLHPVLAGTAVIATIALIPIELDTLGTLHSSNADGVAAAQAPKSPLNLDKFYYTSRDPSSGRVSPTKPRSEHPEGSGVRRADEHAQGPTSPQLARAAARRAAGLFVPLIAMFGLLRFLRRRLRIAAEGRALASRLRLRFRRRLPPRRTPSSPTPRQVLQRPSTDAFTNAILRRAADLAPLVEVESLDRVLGTIESMSPTQMAASEAGMLAECVLETDSTYELRFKLLALEGELEAEAAKAWAERLRKS